MHLNKIYGKNANYFQLITVLTLYFHHHSIMNSEGQPLNSSDIKPREVLIKWTIPSPKLMKQTNFMNSFDDNCSMNNEAELY